MENCIAMEELEEAIRCMKTPERTEANEIVPVHKIYERNFILVAIM